MPKYGEQVNHPALHMYLSSFSEDNIGNRIPQKRETFHDFDRPLNSDDAFLPFPEHLDVRRYFVTHFSEPMTKVDRRGRMLREWELVEE